MSYRYLENIAAADAAFEVMVDTKSVEPVITRDIELKNEAVDNLFFDWLSELVYLKDADTLIFSKFEVSIKKNDFYELKATASGETINQEKHTLRSDVKAVTYHRFEVKKQEKTGVQELFLIYNRR